MFVKTATAQVTPQWAWGNTPRQSALAETPGWVWSVDSGGSTPGYRNVSQPPSNVASPLVVDSTNTVPPPQIDADSYPVGSPLVTTSGIESPLVTGTGGLESLGNSPRVKFTIGSVPQSPGQFPETLASPAKQAARYPVYPESPVASRPNFDVDSTVESMPQSPVYADPGTVNGHADDPLQRSTSSSPKPSFAIGSPSDIGGSRSPSQVPQSPGYPQEYSTKESTQDSQYTGASSANSSFEHVVQRPLSELRVQTAPGVLETVPFSCKRPLHVETAPGLLQTNFGASSRAEMRVSSTQDLMFSPTKRSVSENDAEPSTTVYSQTVEFHESTVDSSMAGHDSSYTSSEGSSSYSSSSGSASAAGSPQVDSTEFLQVGTVDGSQMTASNGPESLEDGQAVGSNEQERIGDNDVSSSTENLEQPKPPGDG